MFGSTLRFDNDREADVEMRTASLSGSYSLNETFTLRAGLGLILDGELNPETGGKQNVEPGGLFMVGMDYRAVTGEGFIPFIDLSLFFGASFSETVDPVTDQSTDYLATDLRFGARGSWNVNNTLFPFLAVRLFGGPVRWTMNGEDVVGSDVHHYQAALGAAVQIKRIAVYGEWAPVGEQGLSAGLSLTL